MPLQCKLVSAEGPLFDGEIASLVATSVHGDLGIHPGHTPLLAMLNPGPLRVHKTDGTEEIMFLSGGFLEVQPEQIYILADSAKRGEQLSQDSIEKSRQDALQVMHDTNASSDERQSAAAMLATATAQLRTLQEIRKQIR